MDRKDRRVLIGFARWNNWWSKIIEKLTKSQWTHTWLEIEDPTLGWICLHSSSNGVELTNRDGVAEGRIPHSFLRYECLLPQEMLNGVRMNRDLIGAKYDYRSLILNLGLLLLQKIWKRNYKPFTNSRKMTCSELMATIMKSGGIPKTISWMPELLPPGDLKDFCVESSAFTFHSLEEF